MKKLIIIAGAVILIAGCGDNEAKRFGYKGADLADDDKMFFSTGPTVTNWVPSRVLSVVEEYPISAVEAALVKASGVIEPSAPLESIPEGYTKLSEEPWFTTWRKEGVDNFGIKGVNGFISHYNEDKKVWETSETFFSSYYQNEADALVALANIKKIVAEKYPPKKFHEFNNCWVAEFLRIRVMCLVGQKPDGTWSCMLDINDKCRPGCGPWEPVEVQAERLADYTYRKELSAWKIAKEKAVSGNHAAIEKVRAEKGLELFGDGASSYEAGDGRTGYQRYGSRPSSEVTSREALWKERIEAISKATGVVFAGEPTVQDDPSGYSVWFASSSSDIYDVRLDMAFPPEKPEVEGPKAEEEEAPTPKPQAEWRELCIEKILPGFEVPPRPQPPAR